MLCSLFSRINAYFMSIWMKPFFSRIDTILYLSIVFSPCDDIRVVLAETHLTYMYWEDTKVHERAYTHVVDMDLSQAQGMRIHEKLQPKNTCFNVIKMWLVRYCVRCIKIERVFLVHVIMPIPHTHTIIIMS